MDELSSDSQRKPGLVVFLRYRSVCLKLRLFANPKVSRELTTRVCSSKRLVEVSQKFLSPSTVRYLRLAASWTPSDYLYLVEVLHRHLLNLRTSLSLERRLTKLSENVEFCLPLLLSVVTLRSFLTHRTEVQGL